MSFLDLIISWFLTKKALMILLNSISLHTKSFAAVFFGFFSVYQNNMVKSINGDKWFHQ